MNLVYVLSFVLLFTILQCEATLDCALKGKAKTTEMNLKLDLLCGYDKALRPVIHHTNRTSVKLLIAPRIIEYDDTLRSLHIKTWMSMNWADEHLTWDKLKYDDIDQIGLDTTMVWVPDLHVYNSLDDMSLEQVYAPVIVDSSGQLHTFMSPVINSHCVPNWANWPFDIHVCKLTLGSKRYTGSTVDFTFYNKINGLTMKYYLPSNEWQLVLTNTSRHETPFGPKNDTNPVFLVALDYQFTLRRHASVYIASYLIPGGVMVLLSLAVLWIPSDKSERIAIICSLLIIQSLYLQYLAYKIPCNGDSTPYIVCFYRDTLALTGLLLLETLVTRSMLTCNSSPSYLQRSLRFIGGNKVLQYVFISDLDPKNAAMLMEAGNDEGSTLVVSNENVEQWKVFVNIVNKACFILLVPVYLLLSVSLLPLNYSFSIQ